MHKVSVIIPVYRAEATLTACLESVAAQTLDELEVVLVDDHGGDGSVDVASRFIASYNGAKTFRLTATPANGGPGAARNCGIEAATGEYLAFLDSDDTLEPDFCRRLWEAARGADADLAVGSIVFDEPDGTAIVRHNPPVEAGPFEGAAKKRYLRRFKAYFTTYLYRRSLLLEYGIRFPGTRSAEDSCFLICALLAARRIAPADDARYRYRIDAASISRKPDSGRWRQRLASLRAMEAFARDKGLYPRYRGTIRLLVLKKGRLMAAKDYLTNNLFKH